MILNYIVLHTLHLILVYFISLEYFLLMFVISTRINMYIDKKRDDTNFDPVYKRIYTRGLG